MVATEARGQCARDGERETKYPSSSNLWRPGKHEGLFDPEGSVRVPLGHGTAGIDDAVRARKRYGRRDGTKRIAITVGAQPEPSLSSESLHARAAGRESAAQTLWRVMHHRAGRGSDCCICASICTHDTRECCPKGNRQTRCREG